MKPKQLTLDNTTHNSFSIRRDVYPKYHNSWHYHEQIELVIINKGTGSLFLGDAINDFSEDTCVLIGSNIPHFWLFHNLQEENDSNTIDCIVMHFNIEFVKQSLFNIPELINVKHFFSEAEKGLIINSRITKKIKDLFIATLEREGIPKFIALLETLEFLCRQEKKTIVSENYSQLNNTNDEQRMRNVMNYIQDHYTSKIELTDLSNEAKMTKNSFCRYFKQKTGKSPTQFVNELRVAHACRLLKNTKTTLKEICFDSGFNNFVSFHKIFKEQMKITPKSYRKN